MRTSRRKFLALVGSGLGAAGLGYSYFRGLRFPPPHWSPSAPVTRIDNNSVSLQAEGAFFRGFEDGVFHFRAFAPEPELYVQVKNGGPWEVSMENVHPRAVLEDVSYNEQSLNLKRVLTAGATQRLRWRFPNTDAYRFAMIGDTGGGKELGWVLHRAEELGADFLLHLGDLWYQEGDLKRAARYFNEAAIPSYVAIGNHDYQKGLSLVHRRFNHLIGPNNFSFRLGGVEFVSIDTATGYWPVARGERVKLLDRLEHVDHSDAIRDRVVFTHKPLTDPDPKRHHEVSASEGDWLRQRLLSLGSKTMVTGHVHIKAELDDEGLYTYISGQGLAHADLIVNRPYAEILMGEVVPGTPVSYQWQPLNMPYELHCHYENLIVLDAMGRQEEKQRLMALCAESAAPS